MRVFVSVPVPDELKAKVTALGAELPKDGIVLVKPGNMHLTLRFLGEVDEGKVGQIEEKLRGIAFGAFRCELKGVGVFPNAEFVKVVWAGCESGGRLEDLAGKVSGALAGFGGDERFSAHLTIARVNRKIEAKAFLDKHKDDVFGSFEVKRFHLMQSVLKPAGPEYIELAVFEADASA